MELRDEIQWDSDHLPITIQQAKPWIKGMVMENEAEAGGFQGGKQKNRRESPIGAKHQGHNPAAKGGGPRESRSTGKFALGKNMLKSIGKLGIGRHVFPSETSGADKDSPMANLPDATLPNTIPPNEKGSGRFGLPGAAGLLCWLFSALMLGACSLPIPAPLLADSAAIGISVREWWAPREWLEEHPEMGYFIRLNEAGDVTAPVEIIRSNYYRGSRLYLLNAKPGRYALVATSEFARLQFQLPPRLRRKPWQARRKSWQARRSHPPPAGGSLARGQPRSPGASGGISLVYSGYGGGFQPWWSRLAAKEFRIMGRGFHSGRAFKSRRGRLSVSTMRNKDSEDFDYFVYTTYFSRPMILKTVVEVLPGRFAVMGAFQVRRHPGMSKADPAQKFYHDTIETDSVDPRGMPIFNGGGDFSIPSRGEMKEARGDAAAEKLFLREALEDFRGTPWEALVRRALARGG